ncbi:WD repeat-containing protein jip5, partial [Coniosporium uncinatum]
SEDQEEEMLCSLFVSGLGNRGSSKGEKVLVGGADGVITLWEKGVWDDQDERITVDKAPGGGESLDVMALVPENVGIGGRVVAVGMGQGVIRFVQMGPNKVVGELAHNEQGEGVVALGFDIGGRMISGGGPNLKVWREKIGGEEEEEEEEVVGEEEVEAEASGNGVVKRMLNGSDDEDEEDEEEDSEEEEKARKRRKKRKRNKGKDRSGGKSAITFKGLD